MHSPDIQVTDTARSFLKQLMTQQDASDLALTLTITGAGTPAARCALSFYDPAQAGVDTTRVQIDENLAFFLEPDDAAVMTSAQIDYVENDTGGQLRVQVPDIKGQIPDKDAPIQKRIQWLLDAEINPSLAAHGGNVALQEITAQRDIVLAFGGGCQGCSMVDMTLKQGIEKRLREAVPDIRDIIDATDHASGENPYA